VILILKDKATKEQIQEVTKIYEGYTKVVVDIEQSVLAAGGEYHIDCEEALIADGSDQSNLWGSAQGKLTLLGLRITNRQQIIYPTK